MGVYENIRKNTYSKPQGVYARIHANDKNDVAVEKTNPNIKLSDVPKININDIAVQSRGGITSGQLRQQANQLRQQKELEKQQEQERWNNLSLGEKIADPFKTAGANIKFGDLGIEENIAWNEYRSKQDEASLKKAQEATKAREEYQLSNDRIGKGNAVTKDFAQYLPQLGGQLKAGLSGAAIGALTTGGVAAGTTAAIGQLGPQVALPEELVTVPAAFLTGAGWGGKGGYVTGTAKYAYDMMAGSAYKTLLDMGVPNDVALELSGDEALISSLIEGGGAIVDLITLGIGKLGSKGATTAGKELAKNRLLAAAKAYGVNLISEPLEEMAQEKVSIETEKKAAEQAGIERMATKSDDWNRIKEAGEGALKVAAVSGGLNAGGNYVYNTTLENLTTDKNTMKLPELDTKTLQQLEDINSNKYQNGDLETINLPEMDKTTDNQLKSLGTQKNNLPNAVQNVPTQQTNTTLPTQAEMVQKANTEQITQQSNLATKKAQKTYQSAKVAGMTDVDMQKAIDLNNMLRSGANLEFYDEKNIPQNVQVDKAKIANGFYQDGTLWINKNSKNKVEQILGHELTHHLETTNSYNDLANTILDSELFYDFLAEKGYTNVAEFQTKLKEMGYNDAQMNNEMVARFVEEKMFTDQTSIDRLARQNTKLVEKIKNWISDLVVSFKGTAQEKELRRIENMYRKALEQARNTTVSAETQYSIAGVKAMKNINDAELISAYNEAVRMKNRKVNNETIRQETGWFQDKNGAWKFEFSDKDMKLKDDVEIIRDKTYRLEKLLKHDVLFTAYPQLRNCKIEFTKLRDGVDGNYMSLTNTIQIDPDKVRSKTDVEGIIIHELQHVIQKIEGFERGASSKKSKLAYYTSLGEIEAADTRRRLELERDNKLNRKEIAPESSKANPKHEGLDNYLSKRTKEDIEKDNKFLQRKGIRFGGGINERYMGVQDNELSTHQTKQTTGLAGAVGRLGADKASFSINPTGTKKTAKVQALSKYAQTLQNKHEDIPEQVNLIQKEVDNGNFTHEVIHDKRSLNYAQKYIEDNGFEDAVKHWDELIKRGKPVDKDELALGQMIYNVAVDNKDTRLVMKMASDLVQEYTEIGRNLQSATLLRKMTPDGRLYALERSVQKLNQDLMQKFDNFENIKIPEELADKLLRSETQKDMDTAVEQIQEHIASQIPATWQEKLNSWRYLAMLGNPRTHIRNIVGNAVFIPAVEMKNKLAQIGELAISKDQRTKATLGKGDAKLLNYAENDFDKNQETIRGENKYDIKSGIQEKRTIYSNGALEAARKGNFKLLEAEDTLFLKFRYKKAFAEALKARGITIEQLRENSPETVRKVNEIRTYAINEAQKATYRDASKVASMVSRSKRNLLNAANQSTGAAKLGYNLAYLGAEGVIPFAKTPINIVKRGIEYSPAGLLNGIKNAVFDVKSGKVTAAQAIDKIAAGATGTAIAGLGFFLASLGLVSGGEEEKDKEQGLKQLKGNQDYALNVLGKSYTIDWSAPSSIPLFIGVELYNSITSEDESAYLNALSNMAEPVVEMSMLQGLNDTLTTLGEDSAIGNIVGKTLTNYLGQYNPTLLGQIARSVDPVRRTTYVDKNIPVPAAAQRFIQQQAAKIPGVSRMLPTYKDQFGQEQITDGVINRIVQNFFSPGYLKDIKEGTVEQGLAELYEKTGETSVIPGYASKTLTQNGKKINLTAKQYDTYAKTRGDISKKGLEGLFKDSHYKNLTDEQKIKIVEAIYDYATNVAKTKVLDGFELEKSDKKTQELEKSGLDFYKYIMLKKTADYNGNGYTTNDELNKAIKQYGLTRWQKTIKDTKSSNTLGNTLPTLASQRAKLPTMK